jgi:iron complex transport system substrate-binding protein
VIHPRIISLLPSATEIVAALGFADHLVGRSHECDFPPGIEQLPACSSSKVSSVGSSSYEIDERVKEMVAEGLSVYRVDAELLRQLAPDIVLTQTQCAVCAVTPRDLDQALCHWIGAQPTILSIEPNNLSDVWTDIQRVGVALAVPEAADRLVDTLKQHLNAIRDQTMSIKNRPRVAAIEWLGPLMVAGNWMPELIEIAGGQSLLAKPGQHSSAVEWSDLINVDPEVILLAPCGFRISQTIADLDLLTQNSAWSKLRAVQRGHVYLIDGHHFFNRPGPRLAESTEIIAEILHPDRFEFGQRGKGWIALSEV